VRPKGVLTSGTLLTFGSSEKSPGWVGPYGLGLFATGRLWTQRKCPEGAVHAWGPRFYRDGNVALQSVSNTWARREPNDWPW